MAKLVGRLIAGCLLGAGLLGAGETSAEWYVAGQVGPTFADRLSDIGGTGSLTTVPPRFPNFDLKNSITYGGKLGYFPGHGWFGLEADVFNTTPHIKSLGSVPGVHLRVTTAALNFIIRYPGLSVQPYVGIGAALIFSRIGESATTQGDSDVSTGLNLIAGTRFFITPYTALFTEYKYTRATLEFDKAFGSVGGFNGDYRAQHVVFGVSYHF
ncbi:MAG TPA: outer membrane beta-barrel protein [Nitrospiraceae bacterium]|nr:outer membrane beta-barrel protein [Nitrospiraceae bacterium]